MIRRTAAGHIPGPTTGSDAQGSVDFGPWLVRFRVRANPRRQRPRLMVSPRGDITIEAPPGVAGNVGEQLIRHHWQWLLRTLARLPQAPTPGPDPATRDLGTGGTIWFRGEPVALAVTPTPLAEPRVSHGPDGIRVALPLSCPPAEANQVVRQALIRWGTAQALLAINAEIKVQAAILGVEVASVRIKEMSSRWGSCSARGDLSFSWRLILAPPAVLRYLVAHELAHLRVRNHGPGFWRVVAQLCPDWNLHRRWLRHAGATLDL